MTIRSGGSSYLKMEEDARFFAGSVPADRNFVAWNMPYYGAPNTGGLTTAGTLFLIRIRRVPATNVSNIVMNQGTAGSGLTAGQCFAALFTSAGALIASTADQAAAWAGAGPRTMALVGGPYALSAADYYVGLFYNGTTGPAFLRAGSSSGTITNIGLAAPNLDFATADTGLTTAMPSTFGAQTAFAAQYFVALS